MLNRLAALTVVIGALAFAAVVTSQGGPPLARTPEELQSLIDSAVAGQTIWLDPGRTFVGHFVLPPWRGPDERPIVIRTAGDDVVAPGQQMSPGRAAVLAKLRSPDDEPVLSTSPGTRFWRIELLEFQASRTGDNEIIALGSGTERDVRAVPGDLVLDRLYIHGDPVYGQKRAIALNSVRTTISNSYISDIKSVDMDSQAIAGWNGPGQYVIQNNYLEAAGDNLLFGGGDPAISGLVPTSIVIQGNTFTKRLDWKRQSAPRWQIKNLLELKNARDVTIERNLLERNWAQAQSGYAILFTVRNQDGGCPWCQVENVRFNRNIVRDVGAGVSILGEDDVYPSRRTGGITIANNLFERLDSREWGGDGYLLLITNRPRNVTVDHNTVIQGESGGIAKIEGVVDGFSFTNNIVGHGAYGIIATNHAPGNDTIRASLPGATIRANVIAGGDSRAYPPGNYFPSFDELRAQFIDYRAGNFRLRPSSDWIRSATGGGPLGAQLTAAFESLSAP